MAEELEYLGCSHEAALLLPWFVADALAPGERERVQAHLAGCAICAADERRERCMYAMLSEDGGAVHQGDADEGLRELMARVEEYESGAAEPPDAMQPSISVARPAYVRWLVAAIVVQAVGLGVLGALLWDRTGSRLHAARFITLSSPSQRTEGPQVRVVFEEGMTVAELQAALSSAHATVIAGPSPTGVYTLALDKREASVDEALGRLRAHPKILFAEPQ